MPNIAMACKNHIDKKVEKELSHSNNAQHKSCCHKENDSDSDGKECSSNCQKSCCSCAATTSSSAFILESQAIFNNSIFNSSLDLKSQFSYVSRAISDGFLDIWLIPKIG